MFSALDHALMGRALHLATSARFWARPNPHVGCVLARGETVIGTGFTQPAGGDHAEIVALRAAGEAARGATAYVTLEPCAHSGRTPACVEALLKAGVARVVAAVQDPNPRVAGGGFARLREAGIEVAVGLLAGAVEVQLSGFLHRQRRGRGRLRIKLAMSLDGRTAMASGESRWITGPPARADVQRLRAESCAIVTGIGTVLADDCALTVRDDEVAGGPLPEPSRRALRVVLDSRARTPCSARVLAGEQPSLLIHRAGLEGPRMAAFAAASVATAGVPYRAAGLDLEAVLALLAQRECNEILLESGPVLAGALLRQALADEIIVYQAPKLLGSRARPLFELPFERLSEALDLELLEQRQLGADLRLRFAPRARDPVF